MNTNDYTANWRDCPDMRPMFVMTKDVERGSGKTYTKGTVVYGFDNRNTFLVPNHGNVSLPLASVKFTGYGDAKPIMQETFKW